MAAHLAGLLQERRARLGDGHRLRRAGCGGGHELGLFPCRLPGARLSALPDRHVAGRRRRAGIPRVRYGLQGLREGRLLLAGVQVGAELARRRHADPDAGLRRKPADQLRLFAAGEVVEARHAVGAGRDGVRGRGRRSLGLCVCGVRRRVRRPGPWPLDRLLQFGSLRAAGKWRNAAGAVAARRDHPAAFRRPAGVFAAHPVASPGWQKLRRWRRLFVRLPGLAEERQHCCHRYAARAFAARGRALDGADQGKALRVADRQCARPHPRFRARWRQMAIAARRASRQWRRLHQPRRYGRHIRLVQLHRFPDAALADLVGRRRGDTRNRQIPGGAFRCLALHLRAVRGEIEGRHHGSVFRRAAEGSGRSGADAALRLWRLRELGGAVVFGAARPAVARAGQCLGARQHPRRRRVRPGLAPGGGQGEPAARL